MTRPFTSSGTPWYLQPMTAYDLESTGVNARTDRIVTGYVGTLWPREQGAGIEVSAKVLINPGVPIPAGATEVHGITDEQVRAHGCDPRDGIESIAYAIARSLMAGFPVVGFNVAYDLTMLHYECVRWGVSTVGERLGCKADGIGPIIDAHVLDKAVDPYRRGSRKLEPTCEAYGVRIDGAHDAQYDALAAARVAYRIACRYEEIGDAPLQALHDRQRVWRREQAAGLQNYLRHKKQPPQPDAVVDPCWPVCVDPTHLPD